MSTIDWSSLDFTSGNNTTSLSDQDNYIAKLLSLDPNLPYPGTNLNTTSLSGGMISSPEASSSDSTASPESDILQSSSRQASLVNNSVGSTNNNIGNNGLNSSTNSFDLNNSHHEKRKAVDTKSTNAALKDRRGSSTGANSFDSLNDKDGQHTHPDDDDDSGDDIDGKKGKGGKTSEKRKEQNRAAQRAFRERKEKHLKDLEDRVMILEQESTLKATENAALKQLMERLQSENERLKVFESAFSFSYDKDVSNSSTMPTSAQFKPPTPPQDELSPLSSSSMSSSVPVSASATSSPFDTSSLFATSNGSTNSIFGASPSAFALPSASSYAQNVNGSSTSSPLGFSPPATNVRQSSIDDQLFLGALSSGPSPASTTAESAPSTRVTTPPELSNADLFSAYRDSYGASSLTGLDDLDALFGANGLIPGATGSSGVSPSSNTATADDLLSAFVKSPSPLGNLPTSSTSTPPAMTSVTGVPVASCGEDGKFNFDLDGLCDSFKQRAVCQEKARQMLKSAMDADAKAVERVHGQE